MQLLREVYPSVDWSKVDFYEGLPWFTPLLAPYITAQALPHFYSLKRYKIYLGKFDEGRAQCLADLLHEAFHVLQAQHIWKGHGFGFFRGLTVHYAALFLRHGYRLNPIEVPAYDQEFRFLDYCAKNGFHGIVPVIPPGAFAGISAKEPALVFREYKLQPRVNYLALSISCFFCALVTVIKPAADVLVFAIRLLIPSRKKKT